MLKQVFSKLFGNLERSDETEFTIQNEHLNRLSQTQIYAIPTISSCFQSSNLPPSLTSYYNFNNELDKNNNQYSKTNEISLKSSSMLSSTSSSSKLLGITNSFLNKSVKNYNDAHTRQIYIAPHCIRYSNSTLDDTIYRIDDDSLNEIAAEILESENLPPKLQIVHYDGHYFAINNSHLQIYKQLQLSGLITHVQADLISTEAIPFALRQHLLQIPPQFEKGYEITDEDDSEELETTININGDSSENSVELIDEDDQQSVDIIMPSSILDKNILVDETYEFGVCDNCLESDEQDEINLGNNITIETYDEQLQKRNSKIDVNLEFKVEKCLNNVTNDLNNF